MGVYELPDEVRKEFPGFGVYHARQPLPAEYLLFLYRNVIGPVHNEVVRELEAELSEKRLKE